jgi:cation:H+ antiporter
MTALLNIGALVLGTLILIYAAKYLVSGLVGMSARLAVPPFILAMLIISIDLEEFAPAVIGAHLDLTALAYASVLGTVIFLIFLALGSAAAIYPIKHPDFPVKYILILGAFIGLNFVFAVDGSISSTEGVICIVIYGLWMIYLIVDLRRSRAAKMEIEEAEDEVKEILKKKSWHFPALFVAGLIGLVIGALLVIQGVKTVLQWWGISQTILGVTLLAIAANSVELVEAIVPAKKGLPEVVIGNVTGSSIFQLLFTVGIAAIIRPLQVERLALGFVFPAVAFAWIFLLVVVLLGRTERAVGIAFMALYVVFVIGMVSLQIAI